jgi:hypothetical protein
MTEITNENSQQAEIPLTTSIRGSIDYETIEQLVVKMSIDPYMLKEGFQIFSKFEKDRHFYLNLLRIMFSDKGDKIKKLAGSTLHTFLRKNWSDDHYILNEERLVR